MLHITLFCTLMAVALCAPERVPEHAQGSSSLEAPIHLQQEHHNPPQHYPMQHDLQKRSPAYNFGLGKRAYSYVSEYKRLPVYNFGLGKRSRLYSFGLGKRSADEEEDTWELDPEQQQALDFLDRYDISDDDLEKRARPYSFGLGKRYAASELTDQDKRTRMYEFGLGKRAPYYNFGLGKRLPGRTYSFGLGKRLSPGKFSFGLGKRERDLNRFNFGLGKRSADGLEDTDEENDA